MRKVWGEVTRGRPTSGWIVALAAVVLAGLVLRVAAFSLYDIGYSDELMQYLEQANRLATGSGIVPWESRDGLRNALIPQALAPATALGHWLAPGTLMHVALARAWFLTLTLIALPAGWRLGTLHSPAAGLVVLTVTAVWWESVLFSEFMLSESLGAALGLAGAALLLDPEANGRRLALAGLLVGMAVLVRLQYAVFGTVLVVAALRLDWERWMPVVAGGMVALAIGAASDFAAGMAPFSWIAVSLKMNLVEGIAARFGASPASAYLSMLSRHLFPFGAPIVFAGLLAGARYRPLLLAALANLLVHSLIAHKEYRFIWLTTLSLLVLAAVASVRLAEYLATQRGAKDGQGFPSALLLCAIWAMASFWSSHATGGARAYRGGGAVPELADRASRDPAICGVAVPFEYKSHVVPALLAMPKPLMLMPEGVIDGKETLPFGIIVSSNALLLRAGAAPAGYRLVDCSGDFLCLFVRDGQCRPDPHFSYQEMIRRAGL